MWQGDSATAWLMPNMTRRERDTPISAVILAGGRGGRLGRDKASVVLGGKTLLQRVQRLVCGLSDDVIVVVRPNQQLGVRDARVVTDVRGHAGVMAAMAAGLVAARHEWSLVVACDMPFISLDMVTYMLSLRQTYDVVVPRLVVGFEPLHALYHKRCLAALWVALEEGRRRVVSFYETLRVRHVDPTEIALCDPEGRSFYNINTPRDLLQAEAWIDESR